MPKGGTPYQTGGGGHNFEQYVQTAFLTTMIVRGNAPCLPTNEIRELAFQVSRKGWETDDLYVMAESAIGNHQLLAQIKSNLVFSVENSVFKEVILDFWTDFRRKGFNRERDRLLIIKNRLTNAEKNQVKWLFNTARTHASPADFLSEIQRFSEKRNRLANFRAAVEEANGGVAPDDMDLWQFLRCMDLLGYDFLQSSSVDETFFLNLIKLSKNIWSTTSEKEIWDGLLAVVSKYNPAGGSFTLDRLQQEEIHRHFDVGRFDPYARAVQKLQSDGEAILQTIKMRIGRTDDGLLLERKEAALSVTDSIDDFPITIITGRPGVGKSALIRRVLQDYHPFGKVFVFRAFQFNQPALANVFAAQGIDDAVKGILSAVALTPDKIVLIDGLENLLEDLDPDNAFKQLVQLLTKNYPSVKIVGTCRRYAIDLLVQRFGLEEGMFNVVEVPPLTEMEIEVVATRFPQLKDALKNDNIRGLLETPKYIEFALTAIGKGAADFSGNSVLEFKGELWNRLVKDYTIRAGGLPAKRERVFIEIAVKRARGMVLFTWPGQLDPEIIDLLEKDGLIIQEGNKGRYAPAHDILEDWALVRYVGERYETHPRETFFPGLGNEPAIRRAFRLWVEDRLQEGTNEVLDLAGFVLNDGISDRYWSDELLIAIFKSGDCSAFFQRFKSILLEDQKLFKRCIHLLRTACKERAETSRGHMVLLPAGSGWREMLFFVAENIQLVENSPQLVLFLLLDWEMKFRKRLVYDEKEVLAAGTVIQIYVEQLDRPGGDWRRIFHGAIRKKIVGLFFVLVKVTKESIRSLVRRAILVVKQEDVDEDGWYSEVLDQCLLGYGNHGFIKDLPDLVIEAARIRWKLRTPDRPSPDMGLMKDFYVLHGGECWGIDDDAAKSPPDAYRTPVFDLLTIHPKIGLPFVTSFLNEAVSFYVAGHCDSKYELIEVEMQLNDGTIRKMWGCGQFWNTYRGQTSSNDLLASMLVALEKYLLGVAARKTDQSREHLQWALGTILAESNNVMTAAVAVSVCIAYPTEVGAEMLPLLSVREFYEWDMDRALEENVGLGLGMSDEEPAFAKEERHRFNALPHRKKHLRGWMDFIAAYQFDVRLQNEKIHAIFDVLKAAAGPDDLLWKKLLTDMDARDHRLGEFDEKAGGYLIRPAYSKDVQVMLDSGREQMELQQQSLGYYNRLVKIHKKEEEWDFTGWNECYIYYQGDVRDFHYDRPVLLAILGLRDFNRWLSAEQREWCCSRLLMVYTTVLAEKHNRSGDLEREFRLMEKDAALTSFHLLLAEYTGGESKNELLALMVLLVLYYLPEHEMAGVTEYLRGEFFKRCPAEAKKVLRAMIRFAHFAQFHPRSWYGKTTEQIAAEEQEQWSFIEASLTKTDDLVTHSISFDTYESKILVIAMLCIPQDTSDDELRQLVLVVSRLFLADLPVLYDQTPGVRGSRAEAHRNIIKVRKYLAEFLYTAEFGDAAQVVDQLLGLVSVGGSRVGRLSRNEPQRFVADCLSQTVYGLDTLVANGEGGDPEMELVRRFWVIWEYVYDKVAAGGYGYLEPVVLLDVKWKKEAFYWSPFDQAGALYERMVEKLGLDNFRAVINVLATAGCRTFLPKGLRWITGFLQRQDGNEIFLMSLNGEQLIQRLYHHHLPAIGKERRMIEDFLYLLDRMMEMGSSQAYLIRENVITYKGRGR